MLLIVCVVVPAGAQQMGVEQFTRLKRPLWRRAQVTVDKKLALLDLLTEEKDFKFMANGTQEAEAEEGDGCITVKLPNKTRYLTIKHPTYGQYTWRVPVKYLKRKKHYKATLLATDPTKAYQLKEQWAVFNISPANAIVQLDSAVNLIRDGRLSAYLPLGTHHYLVESPFYEAVKDSFELTDTAKVCLDIQLQPVYSYLTVRIPWNTCDVYIDGKLMPREEETSMRLSAGNHRLSLFYEQQCYYDRFFEIGAAEKKVISLTNKDLRLQPLKKEKPVSTDSSLFTLHSSFPQAPVTLTAADEDTEIWIDRERMGKGRWSGDLEVGYHLLTTLKDSLESEAIPLWITDTFPVEMDLAVPQTAQGQINIHSNVIGADIYINNVRVGSTPCIVSQLPSGRNYVVSLRKEGYRSTEKKVVLKGNELTDMKIKLKKLKG